MRRRSFLVLAALLLVLPLVPVAVAGASDDGSSDDAVIPSAYIVVLDEGHPGAVAAEHARQHGVEVRHVYATALTGYAAQMSDRAAQRIAADPRVAYVEPDRVVWALHHACGHQGGPPGSDPVECSDIYGTVTDADTDDPIEGATVTVEDTDHSATTDARGDYRIGDVEHGTYDVTADADGYEPQTETGVEVTGDTQVDFALVPATENGDEDTDAPGFVMPWGVERTGAADVQDAGHTGGGVSIYIIDSGIDATHIDLADNLADPDEHFAAVNCRGGGCEYDWDDDHGHGTHVAGTAAANLGNQVVGVAPEATLHAVKVLSNAGMGSRSDVIAGVDWVAEQQQDSAQPAVANMSLGGSGSKDGTCDADGYSGEDDAYHEAICNATHEGVVFSVAAGNSGTDASGTVPAAYDDTVITVSATQCDFVDDDPDAQVCKEGSDAFADFSNYGEPVTIAAPGVDVLSTWLDDETHVGSGTSMAAPHVAGAVALLIADGQVMDTDYTAFTAAQDLLVAEAEGTDVWTKDGEEDHEHDEGFLDLRFLVD